MALFAALIHSVLGVTFYVIFTVKQEAWKVAKMEKWMKKSGPMERAR